MLPYAPALAGHPDRHCLEAWGRRFAYVADPGESKLRQLMATLLSQLWGLKRKRDAGWGPPAGADCWNTFAEQLARGCVAVVGVGACTAPGGRHARGVCVDVQSRGGLAQQQGLHCNGLAPLPPWHLPTRRHLPARAALLAARPGQPGVALAQALAQPPAGCHQSAVHTAGLLPAAACACPCGSALIRVYRHGGRAMRALLPALLLRLATLLSAAGLCRMQLHEGLFTWCALEHACMLPRLHAHLAHIGEQPLRSAPPLAHVHATSTSRW